MYWSRSLLLPGPQTKRGGDPTAPRSASAFAKSAGETVCKPTLAAIANAIFDATGVRLRRVPFRDARVLAALKTAMV